MMFTNSCLVLLKQVGPTSRPSTSSVVATMDSLATTACAKRWASRRNGNRSSRVAQQWPSRGRDKHGARGEGSLGLAVQRSEIKCTGEASGPEIRPDGDDTETMNAIHFRRECTFAKWKAWSAEAANAVLNERHTIWVDQEGFFHGRVDYWQ